VSLPNEGIVRRENSPAQYDFEFAFDVSTTDLPDWETSMFA
jgi:hypothetical protein